MGSPSAEQHRADQEQIGKLEAQGEVDRAMIAYLRDESAADALKIENLEAALVSARRIGAAIGILMNSRKITDSAAFKVLWQTSQNTNVKLRVLAETVIETGTI